MKKLRTFFIVFLLVISPLVGGILLGNICEDTFTVSNIISLMEEQETVVIMDNKGCIVYYGTVSNIPLDIKKLDISNIASCEDEENTTTFILD